MIVSGDGSGGEGGGDSSGGEGGGDGGLGGWQMRWRGSVRARGRWARRGMMAAGEDGGGDDNGNGSDGK